MTEKEVLRFLDEIQRKGEPEDICNIVMVSGRNNVSIVRKNYIRHVIKVSEGLRISKCPTCGSVDVDSIGTTYSRDYHISLGGGMLYKMQFHCVNCGCEW